VLGVIVFATVVNIIFNLIVDILYAWIDPRIRLA
jgi:ABC-type dipeptide/oligopeptide/nickel transport system permease component